MDIEKRNLNVKLDQSSTDEGGISFVSLGDGNAETAINSLAATWNIDNTSILLDATGWRIEKSYSARLEKLCAKRLEAEKAASAVKTEYAQADTTHD